MKQLDYIRKRHDLTPAERSNTELLLKHKEESIGNSARIWVGQKRNNPRNKAEQRHAGRNKNFMESSVGMVYNGHKECLRKNERWILMTINGNFITNYYDNTMQGALGLKGVNSSRWRGGVTGWAHTPGKAGSSSGGWLSAGDTRNYLAKLKEFGNKLNTATSNLLSTQSIFSQMTGKSSDNDALTVQVTKQKEARDFFKIGGSVNVGVSQLATAQQNKGANLKAIDTSNVNSGFNYFSINKGGKEFNFNIDVKSTDSNRTVQQKMADAINRQSNSTGITATVEYNNTTKESTLVLATRDTGANQSFTIQDSNISSNAVSMLGVNNVTQQAQNAQYTVDGNARTSNSNTVDLGNGLSATLKKVTTADVQASAARDNTAINNAIRDIVNNFNQLREAAMDNSRDRGAQSLIQRLDTLKNAYSAALSRAGVTQNKNGYLQIDEKKLAAAIEDGSAERALGNNSGFTQRLNTVAKIADNNPNQFVSYQSRRNMVNDTSSNKNYFAEINFNTRQQNMINNWNMVGMLFGAGI